jgi:two-component system, OmpR family, response regulator MtrA
MSSCALVVEDDDALATVVELTLRGTGMEVVIGRDGRTALDNFRSRSPAIVLLDLMLPDMDGLEVCRRLRQLSDVPIIMMTARDTTADVVAGLEAGADDYVSKPFEAPELLARVRALFRRSSPSSVEVHRVGDLVVDSAAHRVHKADREVDVTVKEFAVLEELARHRGQALSRQQLLELVWGYDHLGDSRLVDMVVQRLRRKVEDDSARPRLVVTVRGVGYRLEAG